MDVVRRAQMLGVHPALSAGDGGGGGRAGLCRTLIFSSVITKNSSWEVLIKNSITF